MTEDKIDHAAEKVSLIRALLSLFDRRYHSPIQTKSPIYACAVRRERKIFTLLLSLLGLTSRDENRIRIFIAAPALLQMTTILSSCIYHRTISSRAANFVIPIPAIVGDFHWGFISAGRIFTKDSGLYRRLKERNSASMPNSLESIFGDETINSHINSSLRAGRACFVNSAWFSFAILSNEIAIFVEEGESGGPVKVGSNYRALN